MNLNILKSGWIIIVLLAFAACNNQPQQPSVFPEARYFAQNDVTVAGEFLQFFEKYGGQESLGLPLTNEITVDGWRIQYFENGRLEFHPENEAAYRVTVGWLGNVLNRRRPPIPAAARPPADTPDRRYYAQTGHTLGGDFLRYFDVHGGSVRFGLPISEPFLLNGQLAQDFQSARFFWSPHSPEGVILEPIGQVHLEQINAQKK